MAYRFEWHEYKARSNRIKHGVSFDEASSVFDDSLAKIFDDEPHSGDEHREIIVGHSIKRRLLLVCFTERPNERIRIVSARQPTAKELKAYEESI
jgi:uncharacterized DUF497 family protein